MDDIQRPCLLALGGCLGKNYQKHSQVDAPHRGRSLSYFDLATVVAEIERILNNRPLTDVSSDPKNFSALTPHMLLTGTPDDATGSDSFMKSDQYRKSWKRWLSEYLPLLQPRQKVIPLKKQTK